ncbi:hypothetical protein G7Y89_g12917 [Cudoniella acicularis]|uniref:FHA domain-containing protein n=1 Tax=Cudoniella acicularis TaxID=354080 RepID=A0A8H4R973_9HELO|nr:hypothetical protein G7Y89_g12917 [Cudoniella acicularis]
MSFGWSVGDVVAALQLLLKIGHALKDSGGASSDFQDAYSFLQTLSRTLQHMNALQYTLLDEAVAEELREQCNHIRAPLEAFLEDVRSQFENSLGANSTRHAVLTAPRKIQWAISTSKKLKKLQERVAIPLAGVGIILGQQIVQTTLKMPTEIQDRLDGALNEAVDKKIRPEIMVVHKKVEDLSTIQSTSTEIVTHVIQDTAKSTMAKIDAISTQECKSTGRLEQGLMQVLESQRISGESTSILHTKLDVLTASGDSATTLISNNLRQHYLETAEAFRNNSLENRAQSSSLHRKLGDVDASVQAIRSTLDNISNVHSNASRITPNSDIDRAVQNTLGSFWLLLSSLQALIRELLSILLAPYLTALYRHSIGHLLLYGDHFLFEDAIGRIKRLPCAQFQFWSMLVLPPKKSDVEDDSEDSEEEGDSRARPGSKILLNELPNIITPIYRPGTDEVAAFKRVAWHEPTNPILCLLSANSMFESKTIQLPYHPAYALVGRHLEDKKETIPTRINGYFSSEVVSRKHAKIWATRDGNIWIRDTKSSNGTYVNGSRLSLENRESDPHELKTNDRLELGIDFWSEDSTNVIYRRITAKVEHAGFSGARIKQTFSINIPDRRPRTPNLSLPEIYVQGDPHP